MYILFYETKNENRDIQGRDSANAFLIQGAFEWVHFLPHHIWSVFR